MESYGAAANAIDKWRSSGSGQSTSANFFSSSTTSQPQPAPFSTHPAPMMLHRSPSGAQKKIRQKREERCAGSVLSRVRSMQSSTADLRQQQQQRLASANTIGSQHTHTAQSLNQHSPSAWSNENAQCRTSVATTPSSHSVPSSPIDYRNLTQLNDYKSILPPPSSGLDDVWRRPVADTVSTPLSTNITASRFSTTVDKPPVTHVGSARTLNEALSSPVAANNNGAYSILRGNSIEEDQYNSNSNNSASEQMPNGECVHQTSGASSLDAGAVNYQNLSFESGQCFYAHGNDALVPYDCSPQQQACYVGSNKPVGQVHPMQAPKSALSDGSTPSSSPPDTLVNRLEKARLRQQPPPLPKKPAKLETPTVASGEQHGRLPTHEKLSKSLDLTPIGERRGGTAAANDELDTPTFPSWSSSTVVKESLTSRPDAIVRAAGGADGEQDGCKPLPSLSNLLVTDPISIANGGCGSGGHSGSSGLSSITQSTDSLPLLSASPSMLSLQNSLHHALSNPEQHTAEQLEALEKRRLESIESLSRRAAERQQDLEAVCDELNSIDQIRLLIFKLLHGQNRLLSRLAIQIVQAERIVELETRLQLQLEKQSHPISAHADSSECDEPSTVVARKRRLAQQLEDALQLRAHYDSRDADLDRELAMLLPSDAMLEWRFYKTNAVKLNVERKQIEDRLRGVKSQLKFLESVALLQPSHHAQY